MKAVSLFSLAAAALSSTAAAVSVSGAAEGFAKGVTGGGDATAVYPDTIDELVSYLGDDEARVIVLSKTYAIRFLDIQSTELTSILASTSVTARAPPPNPAAHPGVPPPLARSPSTRTTGAQTTSLTPPPSV